MLVYPRNVLLSIRNSLKAVKKSLKASHGSLPRPISSELWQRLASHNLLASTRGQRGGDHLRKSNSRAISTLEPQANRRRSVLSEQNGANPGNLLNIQVDTSRPRGGTTTIDGEQQQAGNNSVQTSHGQIKNPKEHGVSLLLANTMSIAPKIDEVRCVILDVKPDLAFFTETWLRDTISENHLHIPGYHFTARNRTTDIHGGVGLYIKNSIKFRSLDHLHDPDFETLWTWLRPTRLPRGIPCLIAGTIYHPQTVNDMAMLNHLAATLTTIEGQHPGCGILLCGDFNRLNIRRLTTQFKLKQLVDKPTRGDRTLDLVLTNLPQLYDKNSVHTLPPFGLSDHEVVILHPKTRTSREGPSRKLISRRDTRASRKLVFGRYLRAIDWSLVDLIERSEEKLQLLTDLIKTGLDIIMPVKQSRVHVNDPPWVSPE